MRWRLRLRLKTTGKHKNKHDDFAPKNDFKIRYI